MPSPRILILRFSSLGDVVLASSLLEILRKHQPGARIVLATKAAYAPLFAEDPRIERVEALDRRGFGDLLRRLEDFEADWILDAHGSLRSRLLCALLPPAKMDRIAKDGWQRLAFVHARLRTRALRLHQLDRYAALVGAPAAPPRVFPSAAAQARAVGADFMRSLAGVRTAPICRAQGTIVTSPRFFCGVCAAS